MMENKYYDRGLGIDGTADELADWAERYTDDYSDDALDRIIDILNAEKKDDKALRVACVKEARTNQKNGVRDIGTLKLALLDGYSTLYDEDEPDGWNVSILYDERNKDYVTLAVTKTCEDEDEPDGVKTLCGSTLVTRSAFLKMSSDDLTRLINFCSFYAS